MVGTNSYITKLKAKLDRAIIQREHWKQLAENRNSIVVTEVCPDSRSVEEYIIDADSVRSSWSLIRGYREQIEALRQELEAARSELAALKATAQDEREAPIVVATAILGGLFHGGSGPELGEIDIEVCMPALEALQCETVDSSDDVFLPLMSVAQHQRILAAVTAERDRLLEGKVMDAETISTLEQELKQSRDAYQHMIDQTTPLEPVPGDPRWSKRIVLDEVIAERDAARDRVTQLEAEAIYTAAGVADDRERIDQLRAEVEKHVPLYEAVERACGELPEGWSIEICIERGAGWVELHDEDGCKVEHFPTNNERIDYTVIDALEAAMAAKEG